MERSWDVVDEFIVRAEPPRVWNALIDEFTGRTTWARPFWRFRSLQPPVVEPGAVVRVSIRPVWRRFPPVRLRVIGSVEEVQPSDCLDVAIVGGSFRGRLTWTLDPSPAGTFLRVRFAAGCATVPMRLMSSVTDVIGEHSTGVRFVIDGLQRHLAATPPPPGSRSA